ncbi:MAG: hypothetical protein K2Q10_07795, partial [Rhodospirillales bacterium]|nr:hypothetical protein [Rhodospirillales bacterium]
MIEIALDWRASSYSGWGNYGRNLSLELLRNGMRPILPGVAGLELNPLEARVFREVVIRAPGSDVPLPRIMLHAMGNELCFAGLAEKTAVSFGIVFFENTRLPPEAVAQASRLYRMVAGSSWNAELLRRDGLTNVELILQGIDLTSFHPAPRGGRLEHRFVVFSGGKLEYRKGQDLVVVAFRRFRQRHPEALLMTSWHMVRPEGCQSLATTGHLDGIPDFDAQGRADLSGWLVRQGIPPEDFLDLGVMSNIALGRCLREADV